MHNPEKDKKFDENSMNTEWGIFRAWEIQWAYWALRTPMPVGGDHLAWSDLELTIPPWKDGPETAFGDAVNHMLLAADQAGLDVEEICRRSLEYVDHVRKQIDEEIQSSESNHV